LQAPPWLGGFEGHIAGNKINLPNTGPSIKEKWV